MDTSKIKTVHEVAETDAMIAKGWRLIARRNETYRGEDFCSFDFLPPEPTLTEWFREFATIAINICEPTARKLRQVADEMDRLEKIEAAVRHARATPPSLCGGRPIQVDREAWGVIEASLAPEEED